MTERFVLNKEDLKKWLINTAIFLAPAGLLFLLSVQTGRSLEESLVVIELWLLNTAIDLTKKFIAEHPAN